MHITAKPTSYTCNIGCDYCFYLEKETFFHKNPPFMSDETLELFIKHYIFRSGSEVYFTWQGGEPTLAGIEFFEKVVELQQKYSVGKQIHNAFQTNGILLNNKWGDFFKRNDFLVGISIDGPKELHDVYRVSKSGKGTFDKVMKGIEILNKNEVAYNTITVINNVNVYHPDDVYQFLKTLGTQHFQFIELLETNTFAAESIPIWLVDDNKISGVCDFSTPALAYGQFMGHIFEQWIKDDIGEIFIRQFESFVSCYIGNGHTSCVFKPDCGEEWVLEANGTLYECDHFVFPDYTIGNIEKGLDDLFGEKVFRAKRKLAAQCKCCDYLPICNGGCPKHRVNVGKGAGVSYFCEGYKHLFSKMVPYLNAMTSLMEDGFSATEIKKIVHLIERSQ